MDKPIRILQVIGMMDRGGAENMIMNLYRHIDRAKVQFDFVEHTKKRAAFDDEIEALGGKIFHSPHHIGTNHFSYVSWWNHFFQDHVGEYDIVHGHIGSTASIYLSAAKKHGAYAIAHSHSTDKGGIMYQVFSYPTRFIADHFFACSHDAGVSRYGKAVGCDQERCQVLPNAINTDDFLYQKDKACEIRKQLGIPDSTLVIGHVGRFVDAKNHTFLLDVFSEIHRLRANSVLLLVGDGELRPQIEKKIQALGLQDNVIMTGVQSNVYDYNQAMDVFVMPSLYEGLPVTLVEAQASGLPCFISDTIPAESALTPLVHTLPLSDSPAAWAQAICNYPLSERPNMQSVIKEIGYDIHETSKWLQNFYENVAKNHGQ